MHTWMDLAAVAMACITALMCTAMVANANSVDTEDDDKTA